MDLNILPLIKSSHAHHSTPEIWCVGAGKGGVGKTLVSSSLAICLSKLGYSVTLIDLDFGGANLHTCIGAHPSHNSLRSFLDGKHSSLQDVLVRSEIPNTWLIPGMSDAWNPSDLKPEERILILNSLRKLKTKYVIIDLGAGALETNLDFFKVADQKILVSSPEPTSIEKTYRYLEALIYRMLFEHCSEEVLSTLIEDIRESRKEKSPIFMPFKKILSEASDKSGKNLVSLIEKTQISFVLNMSRSPSDQILGESMKSLSNRYFGLHLDYLGTIDYDNAVWQSLKKRRPPILDNPFSRLVGQFLLITKQLVDSQDLDAAI